MATSKKTTNKKTEKKPTAADFPGAYIRLRTVLDSLEINALIYCLDNKNALKRIQRIQELEAVLIPIIESLKDKTLGPDNVGVCGEGLFNCGGVCVPYQCPAVK